MDKQLKDAEPINKTLTCVESMFSKRLEKVEKVVDKNKAEIDEIKKTSEPKNEVLKREFEKRDKKMSELEVKIVADRSHAALHTENLEDLFKRNMSAILEQREQRRTNTKRADASLVA